MTPKPTEKETAAEPTTPAVEPAAPAVQPTVEVSPDLKAGDTVKHANGSKYTIRHITPEGVALVGVANLVNPSSLTKV
jgi:hypothetical protein